jgi:hypothetical protein
MLRMKLVLHDPLVGGKDFHHHLFKLYCPKFCCRVTILWSSKTGGSLIFVTFYCDKKKSAELFSRCQIGIQFYKELLSSWTLSDQYLKFKKLNTFKKWLFPSSCKNVGREIYHFACVRAVPIWVGASLPFYLLTTTEPVTKIMDVFLNIW